MTDSNLKNNNPTVHFRSHEEVMSILDDWLYTLPIPGISMLFNCILILNITKEGLNPNSVILLIISAIITIYTLKIATTSNFINDKDSQYIEEYHTIPIIKQFLDHIKQSNRKILVCEYKECLTVIKTQSNQH